MKSIHLRKQSGAMRPSVKLGKLIRQARERRSWTQATLAEKLGYAPQWISRIETGERMSLEALGRLHEELADTSEQESEGRLRLWLLTWLEEQLEGKARAIIQSAAESTAVDLRRSNEMLPAGQPHSLADFPRAFHPLTIVCGDRRESTPTNRGDIFAYSLAITDLMFLQQLGLDRDVRIRSDKLFVVMDKEYLEREFGRTHLLVIGSPAVNLAARRINSEAIFRFDLGVEVKKWEGQLRSLSALNDPWHLEEFWKIAQLPGSEARDKAIRALDLPEEEAKDLAQQLAALGGSPKDLMNEFRKPGLVDPADAHVHGRATRQDNDFAIISLARNPFAATPDYLCVIVAGIHGPGTAHALRALAEDDFKDHPFGGVIEVQLHPFKDWPTRFEQAHWEWQTHEYTPSKLALNLESARGKTFGEHREAFARLTDDEITKCLAFVEYLGNPVDSSATSYPDES